MSRIPLLSAPDNIINDSSLGVLTGGFAVDAYRNKVGSTVAAGGQDVSVVAPHLETRVGKKMWVERKSKRVRGFKRAETP